MSASAPRAVGGLYDVGEDLNAHLPDCPPEQAWERRRDEYRLVNPANRRRLTVIVVGTGLAGAGAAATLGRLGYRVECFSLHDAPRRAHSVAAQGGINAARARKVDGDSLARFVKDTVKGGDYRGREADVVRLGLESGRVIDHMEAIGAPFAREYGGQLATRSFGGVQVSRTYYTRGQTGQQLEIACAQALQEQVTAGSVHMHSRTEMLDLIVADSRAQGIATRDLRGTGPHRARRRAGHRRLRQRLPLLDPGHGLQRHRHLARPPARGGLRLGLHGAVPPHGAAGELPLAVQDDAHERVAAQRRAHLGARAPRGRAGPERDPRGRARLLPGAQVPGLRQPHPARRGLTQRP